MIYRVRMTREARELVDGLDVWWQENRPLSKVNLSGEVERAFVALSEMPHRGSLYRRIGEKDVRLLRLQGTPYSLYYVVNGDTQEVVVISAWSSMVGEGPPI